MLLSNIRGIRPNIGALTQTANHFKADVVVATETLLNPDVLNSGISISGYQQPPLRRDRSDGWGGLIIWAKESLQVRRHQDLEPP